MAESLCVLEEFTNLGDPMQMLQMYYQKKGVVSLATAWSEPMPYKIQEGKECWRISFFCPLNEGCSATSVAPVALLKNDTPLKALEVRKKLEGIFEKWFGNFLISPLDGFVYFKKKKNAKRSTAFCMLLKLFEEKGKIGIIEVLTNKNKLAKPQITPTPVINDKSLERIMNKQSKIQWIHDLHHAGVRRVQIQYQKFEDGKEESIFSPSTIVCHIKLQEPCALDVSSDPQPSKALARTMAIKSVVSALQDSDNPPYIGDANSCVNTLIAKEALLLCDSSYVSIHRQLSLWQCWEPGNGEQGVLYHVQSEKEVAQTPFGLMLPYSSCFCDMDSALPSFEAAFSFNGSDKPDDNKVYLHHPNIVSVIYPELLEIFASICSSWIENKGSNHHLDSTIRASKSANRRKYNFVPLVMGENSTTLIDWDLISSVVSSKTKMAPRDFLSMYGSAEVFMMPLEVEITEFIKARTLRRDAMAIGQAVLGESCLPLTDKQTKTNVDARFTDLLAEATAIFPNSRYERLEFIGDRVLNYVVSLCLFARNGHLDWDHDEFRDHLTCAKRNAALAQGSLRAGLHRLINDGQIKWDKGARNHVIADAHATNIAESIIGATFMHGRTSSNDQWQMELIVLGIMERLNLPMPSPPRRQWFQGQSLCHTQGFKFCGCEEWRNSLQVAQDALKSSGILYVLQRNCQGLLHSLLSDVSEAVLRSELASGTPRLLLEIALFDANLDGSDLDGLIADFSDQDRLQVVGLIRDNLFHVGATALELELAKDLFIMYPTATPGDLQLLLSCALSHDVLAYILIKNEVHRCLFDENISRQRKLLQEITVADTVGSKNWLDNGGWILPGGISTYKHRIEKLRAIRSPGEPLISNGQAQPRYHGIVGGRFCGKEKKVGMNEIDDLQFSLKCIFGALCLSVGTESSWEHVFRPLMEELMLLTPEEYRSHFSAASTICKTYSQGNTNCISNKKGD